MFNNSNYDIFEKLDSIGSCIQFNILLCLTLFFILIIIIIILSNISLQNKKNKVILEENQSLINEYKSLINKNDLILNDLKIQIEVIKELNRKNND